MSRGFVLSATIECAGCCSPVPVRLRGLLPRRHRLAHHAAHQAAHQAELPDLDGPSAVLREIVVVPVGLVPWGTFAERMAVPSGMVLALPDGADPVAWPGA